MSGLCCVVVVVGLVLVVGVVCGRCFRLCRNFCSVVCLSVIICFCW